MFLLTDPTNPFDGQVWYNSTEDFIKYFTAIDSTSQEECLAHGGTFTSGACSINGVTDIVNHTANNFETTSVAVADTGARSRVIINDVGTGTGALVGRGIRLVLVDGDGNGINPFTTGSGNILDIATFTTALATVRFASNILFIGNGIGDSTNSAATRLAAEITQGSTVTNSGLVWNISASVDPDDSNAIIISSSTSTTSLVISISSDRPQFGGGTLPAFNPAWATNQTGLGATSNPDDHTAITGQRFLKGSFSCFTASTAFGTRAYVYLGADYITDSTSTSGAQLDPEANGDWHDITATSSGGGGTSGISQGTADSLYYRRTLADTTFYPRTLADTTFATKTEVGDFAKFSDLGIRDIAGTDAVIFHEEVIFNNPADEVSTLLTAATIDSTTEKIQLSMYVISTNIADINSADLFTVTWGGVSRTFTLTLGVFSGELDFTGLTIGTSDLTISKSEGGTLNSNIKVVLDHAGTLVVTPTTDAYLDARDAVVVSGIDDKLDAKVNTTTLEGSYETAATAESKYATTLQGQTADNALKPDNVRPDTNLSIHHVEVDSRVASVGTDDDEVVFLSADLEDFHSQITQISTHITQNTAALDDYVQFKYYALGDDVKRDELAWKFVKNPSGYVGAWDTTTSYAGISAVVSHDDFFWSSLISIAGTNIGLTPGTITETPLVDLGFALISDFPFTDLAGTNDLRFGNATDAIAFMVAVNGTDATFTSGPRLKLRSGINGAPQDFGGATFTRVSGEANRIAVTNGSGGQVLAANVDLRYQIDSGTWEKLDIGAPFTGSTSWSQMSERPIASDLVLTNNQLQLLDGFDDGVLAKSYWHRCFVQFLGRLCSGWSLC